MDAFSDCNQPQERIEIFRNFSRDLRGFLLLTGMNGTGKTFAARRILVASGIWDSDHKMRFTQAELNIQWQKQIADWKDTTFFLRKIVEAKLILLDDIGTRTPSEGFMDFLYAIVDMRYDRDAATIITTNLNSAQMREKFGDAFVSRVASGIVMKFEGEDRRFQKF